MSSEKPDFSGTSVPHPHPHPRVRGRPFLKASACSYRATASSDFLESESTAPSCGGLVYDSRHPVSEFPIHGAGRGLLSTGARDPTHRRRSPQQLRPGPAGAKAIRRGAGELPSGTLRSTDSAADCSALFVGFPANIAESDFPHPYVIGYGSLPSRCEPGLFVATGQAWDLRVPAQRASAHARFFDHAGPSGRSR